MKQFTARLNTAPDIETPDDFYQYYRGNRRFFGLRLPKAKAAGIFEPVLLISHGGPNGDDAKSFQIAPVNAAEPRAWIDWKYVQEHGLFGTPLIGNHPFGDSYVVLDKTAVRESAKGLGMNESMSQLAIDDKGFGISNYLKVMGEKTRVANFQLPYRDFFAPIMKANNPEYYATLRHVLNPTFLPVRDALASMLAGEKLGVPVNHFLGFHYVRKDPKIYLFWRAQRIGHVVDENPDYPTVQLEQRDKFSLLYLQHQFGGDARIVQ